MEDAIEKEWNSKPLYIREGGSIPAVRFLEKFCDAPAVHFPMGQASDQAHLHNERIRLRNLHAGKRIIKNVLMNVAKSSSWDIKAKEKHCYMSYLHDLRIK